MLVFNIASTTSHETIIYGLIPVHMDKLNLNLIVDHRT